MSLDHDGARRLMAEGVDGRLGPTDERELALHLVGCGECKRLYDGLQHAHPALAAIGVGPPPTRAVDTAVRRATTILRGEADPGPLGTGPVQFRPAPDPSSPTWTQDLGASSEPTSMRDTGPLLAEDAVEAPQPAAPAPSVPAAPLDEASIAEAGPEPVRAREKVERAPVPQPPSPPMPEAPRPITLPPRVPTPPTPERQAPRPEPKPPPRVEPPPVEPPGVDPLARPLTPPEPPLPPTLPSVAPTRVSSDPMMPRVSRADEVEQLFDEDYGAEPLAPPGQAPERPAGGAGPWVAALVVAILLAVLAFVLVFRGQGLLGGGGELPTADEVRTRVDRVFTDMKSLKTSFSIRRLSLYRVGSDTGSIRYSFANGEYSGRFVYDRAEGFRQEVTLNVRDREVEQAKIVQTNTETRNVLGTSPLIVETRPPLGPPDGQMRHKLGMLEEALGTVARILVESDDLEVVGHRSQEGRDLFHVRTAVTPDELSRADTIDIFLDSQNFFPAIVQRSISRADAGVLGPGNVLTDDAISTAFGTNERVATETLELDNVVLDDLILPGDFTLSTPSGSEPQSRDAQFDGVTRAQVGGRLPFKPLFPRTLPEGFEEQAIAVFAGEHKGWGPGGRYPAPDGVMQASYFDGKTTVVLTLRNIPSGPFNVDGSPLQTGGLPITVRPVERDAKRFFYGVSPETPPHAYGFLGNVFAVVTGYVPEEDLVSLLASLAEAPDAVPASPGASPSPGISPSPGTTASPTPSATP